MTFGGISLLAFGAFFTTVPIEVFLSKEMQQQQQDLQNAAELHALARFLGGVGIPVGAIVLAVGIGYLVVS